MEFHRDRSCRRGIPNSRPRFCREGVGRGGRSCRGVGGRQRRLRRFWFFQLGCSTLSFKISKQFKGNFAGGSPAAITNDLLSVVCWVITSHFATVSWWLGGLASCFTSQMAITNHLATVFWLLSGVASCFTNSFISYFLLLRQNTVTKEKASPICRPCGVPSISRKQAWLRNSTWRGAHPAHHRGTRTKRVGYDITFRLCLRRNKPLRGVLSPTPPHTCG